MKDHVIAAIMKLTELKIAVTVVTLADRPSAFGASVLALAFNSEAAAAKASPPRIALIEASCW